jgi:hypothetical protein
VFQRECTIKKQFALAGLCAALVALPALDEAASLDSNSLQWRRSVASNWISPNFFPTITYNP